MTTETKRIPKSLLIAYISVFAALNVLMDLVPFTPVLGIPGTTLSFGWIMSPLTGAVLGAEIGGVSCLISGLISVFQGQPPVFGIFTPFRPALSAFITGMLVSKHWSIPAATLFALIIGWLMLPVGREAWFVLGFHIVALATILILHKRIGLFTESNNSKKVAAGFFIATYCGNISRHLFGNILIAIYSNSSSLIFISAIPLTFAEQLIFASAAMILATALNRLKLRKFLFTQQFHPRNTGEL